MRYKVVSFKNNKKILQIIKNQLSVNKKNPEPKLGIPYF